MPQFFNIKPIRKDLLKKVGLSWYEDIDGEYIVRDKLVLVTAKEAEEYYLATNELYKMYESAAKYVIENQLFHKLDIPISLISQIKYSWINERENHLYGRFDLSGGIDGVPIKLIEFNADTPTLLLETSIIQVMMLTFNDSLDSKQFNNIYESISSKFEQISKQKKGKFSPFLFSSVRDVEEDIVTTKLLQRMAMDKEFVTYFSYLEDIDIDNGYDFWFKLYPWEDMEDFIQDSKTSMLNPAYTLLYQSKGMLAILYELFPTSPYLLKTAFSPIKSKYVKKKMFGREGANIDIVSENGKVINSTDGVYEEYKSIYQEYTNFVKDKEGLYYQAGVFYSAGACGLGFRRGDEILDDMSQFIGHIIDEK